MISIEKLKSQTLQILLCSAAGGARRRAGARVISPLAIKRIGAKGRERGLERARRGIGERPRGGIEGEGEDSGHHGGGDK